MKSKQLALMRERNLYLEKCRQIEALGESINWEDPTKNEQPLLDEIHGILYQSTSENGDL